LDLLKQLFSTAFMPHGFCLRDPGLIKLHAISDGVIGISYFAIPIALFLFVRRRRDLAVPWLFALFGLFILSCACTHVFAVITLWYPAYRLEGLVKAVTAGVSLATAVVLFCVLPRMVDLPSAQQRLAAIVDSSEDAIFSEDLDGIITSWNSSAEEIFGYSAREALGKSAEILWKPGNNDEGSEINRQVRAGKRVSHFETVRLGKDKGEIAVSITASPVRNSQGQIVGTSKIVREITVRKQREESLARVNAELRDSDERFKTLTDFVPDMLWMTDSLGAFSYVSRRYQAYAGLSLQKLMELGWTEILHPDDQEKARRIWEESVLTGQPYEVEYRLRRADGVFRWFVARATPIHGADGEVTQWLGSSTDIDDLTRTVRALRRSNEELEQFAYAAAHDLQEPLRNVANSVGMLSRLLGDCGGPRAAEWIEASIKGAQRMQEMVKDLLTYSRVVEDGQLQMQATTDAAKAARLALQNLEGMIAETEARVQWEPLPLVPVQEAHLVQLFQNLIGNAVKYRQPNTTPVVRVSASATGDEWQFIVADNGIGFDPAYADRIFRLFKRLHNREEYSGNGIGLAICARIVAHYGGRIWAEGEPGKGATFRFTLPGRKL
jgi:PAS domain S-box-containing protein